MKEVDLSGMEPRIEVAIDHARRVDSLKGDMLLVAVLRLGGKAEFTREELERTIGFQARMEVSPDSQTVTLEVYPKAGDNGAPE